MHSISFIWRVVASNDDLAIFSGNAIRFPIEEAAGGITPFHLAEVQLLSGAEFIKDQKLSILRHPHGIGGMRDDGRLAQFHAV